MSTQPYLDQQASARDAYAPLLGTPDADLIVPAINPSLRGMPEWPAFRQAWRTIRRDNHTLLLSDGLSDPFTDAPMPNNGFGIEVLIESADTLLVDPANHWLFNLAFDLSQHAVAEGNYLAQLEKHGVFSMDIPPPQGLEALADSEGYVGILLGLPTGDQRSLSWETPGGTVKVITAKLLFPQELTFIIEQGRSGREELVKRFTSNGSHHLSSLSRPSVV